MKRGSALLVVLGMVAFMIISAVAFSAYMRTSRLPSSFLVRTSSSRFLAKAALAEAIDQLDVAIGNDPYPGCGDNGRMYQSPRTTATGATVETRRRNYWRKNCFIASNRFETAANTVSTLTLEGLAYLPPCMINEARYYSHHAHTARWQSLPYNAGRYAFTAYDVSNYFDINRVAANVGRNSSDNGRISIAYLFEDQSHTGDGTVSLSDWEKFMDNFVEAQSATDEDAAGRLAPKEDKGYLPLVSLADYVLAANEKLPSLANPFCDFIESGNDFVSSTGGTKGNDLRLQMFVTDSWFPKTNVTSSINESYDLTDARYQPFDMNELSQRKNAVVRTAANPSSESANRLKNKGFLCDIGFAALWDYLDADSVPISLAIPTTERTPMICGIEIKTGQGQLKLTETPVAPAGGLGPDPNDATITVVSYDDNKSESESLLRTVSQERQFTLDTQTFGAFFNGLDVNVLTVYPFRRLKNDNTYQIGGSLAFYLAEGGETFHTENENGNDYVHFDVQKDMTQPVYNANRGVFYVPLQKKTMTLPSLPIQTEENAVKGYQLEADGTQAAQTFVAAVGTMFSATYTWKQTRTYDSNTGQYTAWSPDAATAVKDPQNVSAAQCNLPPLKGDNYPEAERYMVDDKYSDANKFLNLVKNAEGSDVRLQLSAWVYIKESGSGDYVDLVPACVMDDDDLNGVNNWESWGGSEVRAFGVPYPLMNLYGNTFTYKPQTMTAAGQPLMNGLDFGISTTTTLFCPDPRWNWAPEHWINAGNATLDAATWLDTYSKRGENGRDRDIFMETSDAGYLQSVYELAFLPRLTDWPALLHGATTGNAIPKCTEECYGNMETLDNLGQTDFKTSFDDLPNNGFMWRTYRPFPYYEEADDGTPGAVLAEADDFDAVGFTSEGTGFRISPYAPVDTLMAAFANTPYSWAVASTNQQSGAKLGSSQRKVSTFNSQYCFNEMASNTRFAWEDLKSVAQNFHDAVREDGTTWDGWKAASALDIDWAGTSLKNGADFFAEVELSNETCALSDADKKFLYGYWRECFAVKQQLFLVFVRAEPTMLGGGSAASAPPSLGARAVALVWRDPTPTIEDVNGQPRPHRTRVLFYRQFE